MLFVLEDRSHIQRAISKFGRIVKSSLKYEGKREMIFPNGKKAEVDAYFNDTSIGRLYISFPIKNRENKISHFLNLSRVTSAPYTPSAELNIPLEPDRNVSGCYVYDDRKDETILCSRGHMTAYRSRLKKDIVHQFFEKWLIEARDGDRYTALIPIVSLNSKNFSEDIAEFIKVVQQLKEKHKDIRLSPTPRITQHWFEGLEFEGIIEKKIGKTDQTYEYSHGPIRNSLKRYLEARCVGKKILGNKEVDLAIINKDDVEALFEVKTSSNFSNQLYKAIGQLFIYREKFGTHSTRINLVLPKASYIPDLGEVFFKLNINIVLYENGTFSDLDGREFIP